MKNNTPPIRRYFIIFVILILCLSSKSNAQTYLKWNAAYWAVGIVNMSVETKISDRWTFNGDVVYSPWKSINGNHFEFVQIIPEFRFYLKEAFNGVYFGGYGTFHIFDLTKWNYWNKNKYQRGEGFGFGATVGFATDIGKRWNLDVYVGGGWQDSQYKGYNSPSGEMYKNKNGSGEWLPYKFGITIAYRL